MKLLPSLGFLFAGACLHGYLFCDSVPGVNYLGFLALALAALRITAHRLKAHMPRTPLLVVILLGSATALYGPNWYSVVFWLCWLAVPTLLVSGGLSLPTALLQGFMGQIVAPFLYLRQVIAEALESVGAHSSRMLTMGLGAGALTLVFAALYLNTSDVLQEGIHYLFQNFYWTYLLSTAVGALLLMNALAPHRTPPIERLEQDLFTHTFSPVQDAEGLRQEALIVHRLLVGLIALATLPALVDSASLAGLIPYTRSLTLMADVHRSVALLMAGCGLVALLAAGVFRQAEGQADTTTRRLFYYFLLANLLLVAVACLKNTLYVNAFGLSFKRIGVYAWLALVIAGLGLTAEKIRRAHSFLWLVRSGTWAAALTLASYATLPTDYWVRLSQMSLPHPDIAYLVDQLSAAELHHLQADPRAIAVHRQMLAIRASSLPPKNPERIQAERFLNRWESHTLPQIGHWQSTNLAGYLAHEQR